MQTTFNAPHPIKKYACHPVKELTLCEILDDAIIQDVMRSDGITRADVLAACKVLDCSKLRMAA